MESIPPLISRRRLTLRFIQFAVVAQFRPVRQSSSSSIESSSREASSRSRSGIERLGGEGGESAGPFLLLLPTRSHSSGSLGSRVYSLSDLCLPTHCPPLKQLYIFLIILTSIANDVRFLQIILCVLIFCCDSPKTNIVSFSYDKVVISLKKNQQVVQIISQTDLTPSPFASAS